MTLEYNTQCPAFSDPPRWERLVTAKNCQYCGGCGGIFLNGVECRFSKVPTTNPKFEVGEEVWYDGLRRKIRKREWKRWWWEYTFARERTPHPESRLYRTRRECEEASIRRYAEALKRRIEAYGEAYGLSLTEARTMLLGE